MAPAPTDRRVRRTQELLRGALVSLIAEKGYPRITVQDLLDRADVGRSTFYTHFRDKEDLLLSGFRDVRDAMDAERAALADAGGAKGAFLEPLLVVLQHVEGHRHMWKPLVQKGGSDLVVRTLRDSTESMLRDHFSLHFPGIDDGVRLEAAIQFTSGAFESLLIWWIDNDIDQSAVQVHSLFKQLASPGLKRTLA